MLKSVIRNAKNNFLKLQSLGARTDGRIAIAESVKARIPPSQNLFVWMGSKKRVTFVSETI